MTTKKKTQLEIVLDLLRRPEGACMRSFVHYGVLRYSARIHEIRKSGIDVLEEPCERTDHAGHVNYRTRPLGDLVADAVELPFDL